MPSRRSEDKSHSRTTSEMRESYYRRELPVDRSLQTQVMNFSPDSEKMERRRSENDKEQTPPARGHPVIRLEDKQNGHLPVDVVGNAVCLSTPEPHRRFQSRKKYTNGDIQDLYAGAAGLPMNRDKQRPRSCLIPNTAYSPFHDAKSEFNEKRAGIMTKETLRPKGVKPVPGWVTRRENAHPLSGQRNWETSIFKEGGTTDLTLAKTSSAPRAFSSVPHTEDILQAAGRSIEEMQLIELKRSPGGLKKRGQVGCQMRSTVDSLVWGRDLDSSGKINDEAYKKFFEGAAGQPSEKRYR